MRIISSRKCTVTLGYVQFLFFTQLLLVVPRSSSTEITGRRLLDANGGRRGSSYLGVGKDKTFLKVVSDSDEEENAPSATEKFLQSLKEQCRRQKSLSLICNNLKLVIPLTPLKSTKNSEAPTISEELTVPQSSKFRKRFTVQKSTDVMDPSSSEQRDYGDSSERKRSAIEYYQRRGSSPILRVHHIPPFYSKNSQLYDAVYSTLAPVSSFHGLNDFKNPEDQINDYTIHLHNQQAGTYPNHKMWYEGNKYSESDLKASTEDHPPSDSNGNEVQESDQQQNTEIPSSADENAGLEASEDGSFTPESISTAHYSDGNTDYGEVHEGSVENSLQDEKEEAVSTPKYLGDDIATPVCDDNGNCAESEKSENTVPPVSNITEELIQAEDAVDRVIDDSVKVFKESLTIKFPTAERVTNKIKEWFNFYFGPPKKMDRDEARGFSGIRLPRAAPDLVTSTESPGEVTTRESSHEVSLPSSPNEALPPQFPDEVSARARLKKVYHNPLVVGLMVKGVLLTITVVGFVMKMIAAKAVFFSFFTLLITAMIVFKKLNTPQGGTIYVHSNGPPGFKTSTGAWDKDGYVGSSYPQRALKNPGSYEVWEKKHKVGEIATSPFSNDRYQYYGAYYKPTNEIYTTTVSSYIT